nr:MAG TPA: cytochrome c-555 [Caudoviricetes sp.]
MCISCHHLLRQNNPTFDGYLFRIFSMSIC